MIMVMNVVMHVDEAILVLILFSNEYQKGERRFF